MTYYELLELTPSASEAELREAYRALVEIHHPDRMAAMRPEVQARAAQRLALLNEAYATLRNAQSRARYDDTLRAAPTGHAGSALPAEPLALLRQRHSALKAQFVGLQGELAALHPRLAGQEAMEERWGRYLFAALGLGMPLVFGGEWAVALWRVAPRSEAALLPLLLFLLGTLATLALAEWVSSARLMLPRLGVATVLVVGVGVGAALLGLGRTERLLALLVAYGTAVWRVAGRPLAAQREHGQIAASSRARLQEELYAHQVELYALEQELARRGTSHEEP